MAAEIVLDTYSGIKALSVSKLSIGRVQASIVCHWVGI
jgi:hypothetical protein